jgi:predicted nucleic acid-binding protein
MDLAIYWDTSAVISVLTVDTHTSDALAWFSKDSAHLISSLTFAEASSVLSRLRREGVMTTSDANKALATLSSAPWRKVSRGPGWDQITGAAQAWNLRGADLWHISMALTLKRQGIHELLLLTYDSQLRAAAEEARLFTY